MAKINGINGTSDQEDIKARLTPSKSDANDGSAKWRANVTKSFSALKDVLQETSSGHGEGQASKNENTFNSTSKQKKLFSRISILEGTIDHIRSLEGTINALSNGDTSPLNFYREAFSILDRGYVQSKHVTRPKPRALNFDEHVSNPPLVQSGSEIKDGSDDQDTLNNNNIDDNLMADFLNASGCFCPDICSQDISDHSIVYESDHESSPNHSSQETLFKIALKVEPNDTPLMTSTVIPKDFFEDRGHCFKKRLFGIEDEL